MNGQFLMGFITLALIVLAVCQVLKDAKNIRNGSGK
jgi:hypothetical protein